MPIYDYLCVAGHRFDRLQSFSDASLTACEVCGKAVRRVLHAPAVHFKGKGFYSTDYGSSKGARKDGEGGGSESGDSSKTDSAKSDSAKSETSSGTGDSSSSSTEKSSSGGEAGSGGSKAATETKPPNKSTSSD